MSLVVAFVIYFVVSGLVRSMLATFLRGTGDSLLLVALLHSVFNRTNNDDGIVATLTSGDARLMAMAISTDSPHRGSRHSHPPPTDS